MHNLEQKKSNKRDKLKFHLHEVQYQDKLIQDVKELGSWLPLEAG